ncbi:hypothetical protein ST47_g9568 [Ascochyta rabiei]|uniref:Uncharacterized protein n=1 Tax=Didymella rabiei TaxID=5454 RepID=A0A162X053_DIDRA|nr:hypothetical protein ST47_g9568 [Ascochyta rabiei]
MKRMRFADHPKKSEGVKASSPKWRISKNHDGTAVKGIQGELVAVFNRGFAILQEYSLFTVKTKMNAFAVYLSTQFPIQAHLMSFSQTEHQKRSFINMMLREFPTRDFENWAKCEQLLPQVNFLYHMQPSTVELSIAWAQTLSNAAWYLWKTGKYKMAQDFLVKALAVMELVLEPHNEQMLSSVDIMAGVMSSQGRYSQAEELHWQALKGFKKDLGYTIPSL